MDQLLTNSLNRYTLSDRQKIMGKKWEEPYFSWIPSSHCAGKKIDKHLFHGL